MKNKKTTTKGKRSDSTPCSLLPCPFCGQQPAPLGGDDEEILCGGCGTTFLSFVHTAGEARAATIEKWNTRADMPEPPTISDGHGSIWTRPSTTKKSK